MPNKGGNHEVRRHSYDGDFRSRSYFGCERTARQDVQEQFPQLLSEPRADRVLDISDALDVVAKARLERAWND